MEKAALKKALRLHRRGALEEAKRLYSAIVARDENNAAACFGLGMIAAQLKKIPSAITWLKKTVALQPQSARFHLQLANILRLQQNTFDEALEHFKIALLIKPNYAEAHNNFANFLVSQHRYAEALKHYAAAVNLKPDYMEAHHNLGLLLLKMEKFKEAEIQFQNVIALYPDSFNAHFQIANLCLSFGKFEEAIFHYKELLRLNPNFAPAYNNLGVIALKKGEAQKAIDYFTRCLALDDENVEARSNIAATFLQYDRFENALRHYRQLLKNTPNDIEANFNSGVALMSLGKLQEALEYFFKVLKTCETHTHALTNIGAIYLRLKQTDLALQYYKKALDTEPNNPTLRYMIAALTGIEKIDTAPQIYIKNLFDNYATHFESHLKQLAYRAPELLREHVIALRNPKPHSWNILDLGCGTGLVGQEFSAYAKHLVGIDLSPKMIEEARRKEIYQELFVDEIENFLTLTSERFDLIVAADVLCYFGSLAPLFEKLVRALKTGGIFAFTVEQNRWASDFELQNTARFCHGENYIQKLASENHLKVLLNLPISYRKQEDEDVESLIFILEKNLGAQ